MNIELERILRIYTDLCPDKIRTDTENYTQPTGQGNTFRKKTPGIENSYLNAYIGV